MRELVYTTTALMFGRRSYEVFAPIWRESDDHAAYRELPKYVISTTLPDDALVEGWGPTTILRSAEDVLELKKGQGRRSATTGSRSTAPERTRRSTRASASSAPGVSQR